MIQENEILTLILGLGVWLFIAVDRVSLKGLPSRKMFISAFAAWTVGWVLTLLEGFIWPNALNLLEHICYAISSILFAVWCWRVLATRRDPAQ